MNITVAGTGYVGMSMCALLAPYNEVIAYDIDPNRIELINSGKSTVVDPEIEKTLINQNIKISGTTDKFIAFQNAEFVIVATPTNYDEQTHYFDTSSVKKVIEDVKNINPDSIVVIKSTIPVGFVDKISSELSFDNVIFSPEFLREGSALYDNYYPSRIIVGENSERGRNFARLLKQACKKPDVPILLTKSSEAEAIKLFANNYLAMRIAFFNELDTYAESLSIDSKQIIEGIGLDPRIGMHYHNPSFGYGGYCLPKDTKQLKANMEGSNCQIVPAVIAANAARKEHIFKRVLSKKPSVVGVYKLAMKAGSDNFRSAAVFDIMEMLQESGIQLIVYEPSMHLSKPSNFKTIDDIKEFFDISDVIIANRVDEEIKFASQKIYTRDIYHDN